MIRSSQAKAMIDERVSASLTYCAQYDGGEQWEREDARAPTTSRRLAVLQRAADEFEEFEGALAFTKYGIDAVLLRFDINFGRLVGSVDYYWKPAVVQGATQPRQQHEAAAHGVERVVVEGEVEDQQIGPVGARSSDGLRAAGSGCDLITM